MAYEFHIVTVGNSLLRHWLNHTGLSSIPMHDASFWSSILENQAKLHAIQTFLDENPSQHSAEIRSLEGYLKHFHRHPSDIFLYLIGSQTPSNDVVRSILLQHLKKRGFHIFDPQTVPGYSLHPPFENPEISYQKGLSLLLEHCVTLIQHIRKDYKPYCINATGGYKAHVIVAGLTAFITGATLYYIHEEFQDIIVYPPLFYYPPPDELERFRDFVQNRHPWHTFPDDELKRWIDYRMVECVLSEGEPTFRVTPKGEAWLAFFHSQTHNQEA